MIDFDFISDERFQKILIRDYQEIEKCLESKSDKAVLILTGSIIESLLVEFFTSNIPIGTTEKKVLAMDLGPLIDLAFEEKLISESSKNLATVIRHYRNLIHPGREIRKNEKFDNDTAVVAFRLLRLISNEIRESYLKNAGHKAKDILNKLENDNLSHSIFDKLVEKLPKQERIKLYEALINYDFEDRQFQTYLRNPKKYLAKLKPFITRTEIDKQLRNLVKSIETGEKWEVMIYYNLLFDDVHYLDDKNLELVTIYILSALKNEAESIFEMSNFEFYVDSSLFSTFGDHLKSKEVKQAFFDLIESIVKNYKQKNLVYFNAFEQMLNSLDEDRRGKVEAFVEYEISKYYSFDFLKEWNDGNYLPF